MNRHLGPYFQLRSRRLLEEWETYANAGYLGDQYPSEYLKNAEVLVCCLQQNYASNGGDAIAGKAKVAVSSEVDSAALASDALQQP
jgi:hypothetical protein